MITDATFVDLSAAYDTVNHRILFQKLYNITQGSHQCRVFKNVLSNRRYYVELNKEPSRWRIQKNGLPKGVSSHQSCSTSTLMISHFMIERVSLYMQTIYVSQPSTLHSQRWREPLEMHWIHLHSIIDPTVCAQTRIKYKLLLFI